jgi:hypothetical protein
MTPRYDDKDLTGGASEPAPDYEGGARKYPWAPDTDPQEFDQQAAENKRPVPYGLTEPLDETPQDVDLHLAPGKPERPAPDNVPRRPAAGLPDND